MTSPELDQALTKYQHLVEQVNLRFKIYAYSILKIFHCRAGCHQCCLPNLSVSQLEAKAIQRFLSSNPELSEELRLLEERNPHQGQRCSLLKESWTMWNSMKPY